MTCGEVREYMFAFLDNELDAPLSIELQRHLDGCPDCAREAEIERMIGKRISAVIEAASGVVPALPQTVEASFGLSMPRDSGARRPCDGAAIHWRRRLATAALLAFVVGAGAWFALREGGEAGGTSRFADLVVRDFRHFLDEGRRVQFASGDPQAVAQWLREQTALAVVLPTPVGARCQLVGSRKCKIDGRTAAFAVYDMDGTPVSLVALAADREDLDGMEEIRHGGSTCWVDSRNGLTVVAQRRGELVYAAVSTLGRQNLLPLMTERNDG